MQNDAMGYRQNLIGRCDGDGSHLVWLTNDSEPGVQRVDLDTDGRIYFNQNYHGGQRLLSLNEKGKSTVLVDAQACLCSA